MILLLRTPSRRGEIKMESYQALVCDACFMVDYRQSVNILVGRNCFHGMRVLYLDSGRFGLRAD